MAAVVLLLPGSPASGRSQLRGAGHRRHRRGRNRARPAYSERTRRWTALGRSGAGCFRRSAAGCVILSRPICAAAGAYQILALIACLTHLRRRDPCIPTRPGVSILKPIHGADDHFWPAICQSRADRISRVRNPLRRARSRRFRRSLHRTASVGITLAPHSSLVQSRPQLQMRKLVR